MNAIRTFLKNNGYERVTLKNDIAYAVTAQEACHELKGSGLIRLLREVHAHVSGRPFRDEDEFVLQLENSPFTEFAF